MSLIARNALCPCRSGRKYKRCCFARHRQITQRYQERSLGLNRALEWLFRDHLATALWTIDTGFFGGIAAVDRPILFRMPDGIRNILMNNAYEWFLFDAEIAVGDPAQPICRDPVCRDPFCRDPVWKRVLGPDGPTSLEARAREWIATAAAAPLGVYEVVEVHRGLGCEVRDLADRDARPIPITEPATWENFHRGDVLGLRLVHNGDIWERSSAAYGFDPRSLPDIEDEIRRVEGAVTDPAKRAAAIGTAIRELWTQLIFVLFRADPDAGRAQPLAEPPPMLGCGWPLEQLRPNHGLLPDARRKHGDRHSIRPT